MWSVNREVLGRRQRHECSSHVFQKIDFKKHKPNDLMKGSYIPCSLGEGGPFQVRGTLSFVVLCVTSDTHPPETRPSTHIVHIIEYHAFVNAELFAV